MDIAKPILEVLVRLPFWALFSTPLFVALFFVGRGLRNRGDTLPPARILLGIFSALLLFPMPFGMFLAFIPNAYFFFGGAEYYVKFWKWAAISFLVTSVISCLVVWWLLPPRPNAFFSKLKRKFNSIPFQKRVRTFQTLTKVALFTIPIGAVVFILGNALSQLFMVGALVLVVGCVLLFVAAPLLTSARCPSCEKRFCSTHNGNTTDSSTDVFTSDCKNCGVSL